MTLVICPSCHEEVRATPVHRRRLRCPNCGYTFDEDQVQGGDE